MSNNRTFFIILINLQSLDKASNLWHSGNECRFISSSKWKSKTVLLFYQIKATVMNASINVINLHWSLGYLIVNFDSNTPNIFDH